MSNPFYTPTGSPATSSTAASSTMRNEFNAIEDGFDKLATLSGNSNLPVFVNTGETGQEAVSIATALTRLGLPTNLATLTLPASVTISVFGATVIDDADAAAVRTTLGVVIGTNVQAYDAFLGSISALGTAADKIVYTTGVDTAAETALTAFARSILDDADAAAVIATLGLDADIATFSLPASTTISAFAKTVLDDADAAAVRATIGAISITELSEDTTPELGGELDCGAHSVGFTLQTATGDGTTTIDWRLGNKFKFTFGAANETFTFTAPTKPCSLQIILVQDGTGSRTVTWPTIKWHERTLPTLQTTGGYEDIVSFIWDGTSYYGMLGSNFGTV